MSAARLERAPEFEQQLRDRGRAYHIHHPFNVMLNTGRASREQIRGWVANRFYYQINIPIKDAAILANCDDRAVRRNWVQRILDHDGYGEDPGGIESWLRLAEAVGLRARAGGEPRRRAAGRALRRRRLRQLRAPRALAGGGVLLAHRAVRAARSTSSGSPSWPRALSVDRAGRAAVLPEPREPGAARRRVRAGGHARALPHPRRSRSGRSRSCSSSSMCCGR